jgi:hypothetical protein
MPALPATQSEICKFFFHSLDVGDGCYRDVLTAMISEFRIEAALTHLALPEATRRILEGKLPASEPTEHKPATAAKSDVLEQEVIFQQLKTDKVMSCLLHTALELIPDAAQLFRV